MLKGKIVGYIPFQRILFFFIYRNQWEQSDRPYNWGRLPWVRRRFMRSFCARKGLGTKNKSGSGWYSSAFSKFPVQLNCCVSSGFTDFCFPFDNFMLLVSVLRQIFQAIRCDTKRFLVTFSVSLKRFSGLVGSACPETVPRGTVSSGDGDLSCGQHDRPNETVIKARWCRCWEVKPELKLWCWVMCFCRVMPRIFLVRVVWKWFS